VRPDTMLVLTTTSSDKRPLSSSSYDSDSADDLSHQSCGSPTKSKGHCYTISLHLHRVQNKKFEMVSHFLNSSQI